MNGETTLDKVRASAVTILVHFAVLLLLLFVGVTNNPPLKSEQGIQVNFGTDDFGEGRLEPATDVMPSQTTPMASAAQNEKTPLTQDFEEAPSVITKKDVKKVETKNPVSAVTDAKTTNKNTETKITEPQQKVNPKALFPGQKSDGGDQGEGETGKFGNQGDPNGSRLTGNRIGGGDGTGNVPSFSLAGRGSLTLPTPKYSSQAEGRVVVEITVDREGNVVKANPTIKGSTVQDDKLFEAARNAAMKAKFNVKADAPAYQVGTITYNFKLQ